MIKVTLPIGPNDHSHLNGVIRNLRPEGVFLDGFCKGMEKFVLQLRAACQSPEDEFTSFFGATASMKFSTNCFYNAIKFTSSR